jgi:hypothetical protein
MSSTPPDITISVGYFDGEYLADIRFRKLKDKKLSITGGITVQGFLGSLIKIVNGTEAFVLPAEGRTYADLAQYRPESVTVCNKRKTPVEKDDLTEIRKAMLAVKAEWLALASPRVAG